MRHLLFVAVWALSGCTYAVADATFRTVEEDTAFDRAVRAVEDHCHGVKQANKDGGVIFSHWQAWHTADGVVLSRCLVSMVQAPEDTGLEVRVAFTARQCPLVDVADLEAIVDTCAVVDAIPSVVADQLTVAARAIEQAVRR